MSLFFKHFDARRESTTRHSMRQAISILCLSALLPLAATLSGCGEAPKIPSDSKSSSDGPTAGAPAPQDEEKSASGGEQEPMPDARPTPEEDVQESRSPDSQPSEAESAAREEMARRTAEAEARWRAQQQDAAKKQDDGLGYGQPKSAEAPSPPKMSKPNAPATDTGVLTDREEATGTDDVIGAPAGGAAPPPAVSPPPPAPAPSEGAGAPDAAPDGTLTRGIGRIGAARAPAAEPPKAFDTVPVFYGTDRVVEPNAKRLQFGTERGHKLQLGRAIITVPTAHKVPNIERPWVVELPYFKYKIYEEKEDPAKHFTMQEIAALTKEQMLVYVKERLAKSVSFKDHAFVFVHGFNTSFDAAIYRSAQIAYDMKFDGVPFVYSWPSGGKVASYTYDRGSAEQSEPHLAEFLEIVVKESGAKSISLIAHSMGNELLMRVLERMRPVVPDGVVISQVILAAPDVDRDKFTNIARQITNFAQGVTLYAASNDKALGYSARFWGGVPRAGDVPATGPLIISGVDTIDVTAVSTDSLGLNHSGYAENKTLLNDIALLLQTGERPPDKRIPILQKVDTAAGAFWRYPAGAP